MTSKTRSQRYGEMIMDNQGFNRYPYLAGKLVHIADEIYGIEYWDDSRETSVLAAIVTDVDLLPFALAALLSHIPYELWIHSDEYPMGYAGAIIAPYGLVKCKLPESLDVLELDPMYELFVNLDEVKAERKSLPTSTTASRVMGVASEPDSESEQE